MKKQEERTAEEIARDFENVFAELEEDDLQEIFGGASASISPIIPGNSNC
jgi:hypothetical protein